MIKHKCKCMRLNRVLKGEKVDLSEIVELAFEQVNQQGVKNSI